MKYHPPRSEAELLTRAQALSGQTLAEIAAKCAEPVPTTLHQHKGWVGQLIEKALGAQAGCLSEPDFITLGIELKTLPINAAGTVQESTFICSLSLPHTPCDFVHSRVWRKMAKILWVPVECAPALAVGARKVGTALLWSPSAEIFAQLQQDWEELIALVTLGHFDALNAHKGQYLQIRPKAANAKTFVQVIDNEGRRISTVPKGFYVRTCLTQAILAAHFAY